MKTSAISITRILSPTVIATIGLFTLAPTSQAKDKDKDDDKHKNSKHHKSDHDDHDRQSYTSRPRSSFTLSFGSGYAGNGYYYGPANSPYYYERPDVRYYATREAAPREYYNQSNYGSRSSGAAVQRALAQRGYYNGAIDGAIGPQSRHAISHYQQEHGMRVTGYIDSSLLQSLGL